MIRFKLLIPFALLLLMCCGENDVIISDGEINLKGRWKLIEFCQSPGDISCPKQIPDYEEIYVFEDSEFSLQSRDISCNGTFEIVDQGELKVIQFVNDQSDETGCVNRDYYLNVIDNNHININPFCFEECTYLYERQ